MDYAVKDAVLSGEFQHRLDEAQDPWYSEFLNVLKNHIERSSKIGILRTFLMPFIIQFNACELACAEIDGIQPDKIYSQMHEWLSRKGKSKPGPGPKERMNEVADWFKARYGSCQGKYYEEVRMDPYRNITRDAKNIYFPTCLKEKAQMWALIGVYAEILNWVFRGEPDKLLEIDEEFRQIVRSEQSGMVLEDSTDPAQTAAISLYGAILVSAFPKVRQFRVSDRYREELRSRLPVRNLLLYPREGQSVAHTAEITQYIHVVESFPAGTMERHQAMGELWKIENYYAGWELYEQYRHGAVLVSAAGTRQWRLRADYPKAAAILERLSRNMPSEAVAFYRTPNQTEMAYYPQMLAYIDEMLREKSCDGSYLDQEVIPTLRKFQNVSDDAQLLFYLACEKNGREVSSDFLLKQKEHGNPDVWDRLAFSQRVSLRDLENGARCGSGQCLIRCFQLQSDHQKLSDLVYDLLQLSDDGDTAEQIGCYQTIQRCYDHWRASAVYTIEMLRLHADNVTLLGCGLRRLQRKVSGGNWSGGAARLLEYLKTLNDMQKCQTGLEQWWGEKLNDFHRRTEANIKITDTAQKIWNGEYEFAKEAPVWDGEYKD